MKEIYPNLYIGSQNDYESIVKYQECWFVIHACKEPYHRQALGYFGRSVSKDNPEYLIARRDNCLILNLIDADSPNYIPKEIIDEAIHAIHDNLENGVRVFVHCNQGVSRSAVIGLLYLKAVHAINANFTEAEKEYLQLYPLYNPANGMRMFAQINWNNY